jgi:predicted MPP superfamily phosphohydrolase
MDQPVWKIPEALTLVPAIVIQWMLARMALGSEPVTRSPSLRRAVWLAFGLVSAWLAFGLFFMMLYRLGLFAYSWPLLWLRGGALLWAICSAGILAIALLLRLAPGFDPERRRALGLAGTAAVAAPVAAVGFGVLVERTRFRLREVDIPVPGLPRDLQGLRLVQISDIHLSPYLSAAELARAVAMANETRPQVALVTGDLITALSDPLDDCLRELARLRAEAGVLGCLGNHEIFARCESQAQRQGARLGLRFLRRESESLRFGDARVNFAGVDYQRKDRPYLRGAEKLIRPGEVNILLSHNPDVFPVAAAQGYDVTIAGHTHGGQITVEILHQWVNLARFFTPYVYGLYRTGKSSIYVTRGIGTVGVPLRTGAPPEIALLRLCAT